MEKYGVIPPLFTKKWWEYFWDYYKIQTITVICVIILIVTTLVQCANTPEYDLQMMYVHAKMLEVDDICDKLEQSVGSKLDDITGDGEVQMYITEIPIVPTAPEGFTENDKYNIELMTKFDMELTFGERSLMLVDKDIAQMMKSELSYYGYLEDLSKYGDFGDKAVVAEDGKVFGVDVSDNKVFEEAGLKTEGLYLMARTQLEGEDADEELRNIHSNTLKALEYILK